MKERINELIKKYTAEKNEYHKTFRLGRITRVELSQRIDDRNSFILTLEELKQLAEVNHE